MALQRVPEGVSSRIQLVRPEEEPPRGLDPPYELPEAEQHSICRRTTRLDPPPLYTLQRPLSTLLLNRVEDLKQGFADRDFVWGIRQMTRSPIQIGKSVENLCPTGSGDPALQEGSLLDCF